MTVAAAVEKKRARGAIELVDVTKSFRAYHSTTLKEAVLRTMRGERHTDRRLVLDGISFSIAPGERVAIVGRNGAGKSTLFRILSGILVPDSGEAHVVGRVAPLIEVTAGFVADMTGEENLRLNAAILGLSRQELVRCEKDIVAFAGLQDFMDTPMRYYSSGMQTRLGFSIVAHVDADILLIDEALSVGDAEFQKKSVARMEAIADAGATVVFVSHDFDAIKRFCRRAIWLENGKVKLDAPVNDIVDAMQSAG